MTNTSGFTSPVAGDKARFADDGALRPPFLAADGESSGPDEEPADGHDTLVERGREAPGVSGDIVAHLKARLAGLTRTLALAQDAIGELRGERAKFVSQLQEKDRKIAALQAEIETMNASSGLAEEVRSGLRRLLLREFRTAGRQPGQKALDTPPAEEPTVVLEAHELPDADQPRPGNGAAQTPQASSTQTSSVAREPTAPRNGSRRAAGPRSGHILHRYLIPREPHRLKVFELAAQRSCVGRGTEADICVADATVSRLHGVLYLIGGATIVEDARSRNGTHVNGQRVQRAILKDGDEVAFGAARFEFRIEFPSTE